MLADNTTLQDLTLLLSREESSLRHMAKMALREPTKVRNIDHFTTMYYCDVCVYPCFADLGIFKGKLLTFV